MRDETTLPVELTLEESGTLYHMLLTRLLEEEKVQPDSMIFTQKTCVAIRSRQVALLRKLARVNNELREHLAEQVSK